MTFFVVVTALILLWLCTLFPIGSTLSDQSVVIVVPGGGLTTLGELPSHSKLRVDEAFKQFTAHSSSNPLIITLSGGTPHKPNPLDSEGFPVWEATAAAKALLELGVPASNIMEEITSLDTIGNVRNCVCCLVVVVIGWVSGFLP